MQGRIVATPVEVRRTGRTQQSPHLPAAKSLARRCASGDSVGMAAPLRIAITGASGFVGRALATALRAAGHLPIALVRRGAGAPDTAAWDPVTGDLDVRALGAVDAVVHLAGENVASGRWTAARKQAIAASRGPSTERLCRRLATLARPPRVLVAASAIGIYGDRGDEVLDEASAPGQGFLAEVASAWEAATQPAAAAGIRVVNLRIGLVLDGDGGALARMRLPFRLGLGGRLGNGRHWMSWITRADLVRAILFAITDDGLRGPVLATSPQPVDNRTFTAALGRALHRPAVLPVPAFALRLLLGELATMLLASQRCAPGRLLAAGFAFTHPTIDEALRAALRG